MAHSIQTPGGEVTAGIPVLFMRDQLRILHVDDDWTGLSNREERKKRQNRLNQRSRRRRLAQQSGTATRSPSPNKTHDNENALEIDKTVDRHAVQPPASQQRSRGSSPNSLGRNTSHPTKTLEFESICRRFFQVFISAPHHEQSQLQLLDSLVPSLPADTLLTLTQYNVYRAFITNGFSMGLDPETMKGEIPSPFTILGPLPPPPSCRASSSRSNSSFQPTITTNSYTSLAPPLHPTDLQRTVHHHPYIDIFPMPSVRDKLLLAQESAAIEFDDMELCMDVFGMGSSAPNDGKAGMIIWGEPWDPWGWEVSESMVRKWPWLITDELLRSTNYWRAKRMEEPIKLRIWEEVC